MENFEVSAFKQVRLGRKPLKSTMRALSFVDFFKFVQIPIAQTYWKHKQPLPHRSFGNIMYGDCTRAKQAVAIERMERLEQRRLVTITDEEVIRVYKSMSDRLYGGGDNGAYEDDALNEWRNPDLTIRDTSGHPYTIDAYLRIDAKNPDQIRAGLALAGAKGIAICINLPMAFSTINPPAVWDVPEGQPLTGPWEPGSWGGHSMWAQGYDSDVLYVDSTWEMDTHLISWRAVAAYVDEAHLVIDSVDAWRKRSPKAADRQGLGNVIDAVNAVSSIKIAV